VIEALPDMPDGVLGFEAVGEVHAEDYVTTLVPAIEAHSGPVRLVYVLGERFDPERMCVVGVEAAGEAAGVADGTVLREVQRGFFHHGELLRVAQVIVSKKANRT